MITPPVAKSLTPSPEAVQVQQYGAYLQNYLLPKLTPKEVKERQRFFNSLRQWVNQPDSMSVSTEKKNGADTFTILDTNGFMAPQSDPMGVPRGYFWRDMQHLDQFEIKDKSGNLVREIGHAQKTDGGEVYQYAAGATQISREDIPDNQDLTIRLQCQNNGSSPEKLAVQMGAHIQDTFQIRADVDFGSLLEMQQRADIHGNQLVFDAKPVMTDKTPKPVREDHVSTVITLAQPPQATGSETIFKTNSPYQGEVDLTIPPHSPIPLELKIKPYDQAFAREPQSEWNEAAWNASQINFQNIKTDSAHQALQKILQTSDADIRNLMIPITAGEKVDYIPGAGSPKYLSLFGRDSLITSWQWLTVQPQMAKDTLHALAYYQGKQNNAFNGEQPGKILHELRQGELSRNDLLPFHPSYASMDATLLFVNVLGEYVRQTGDQDFLNKMRPNLEAALQWIDNNIATAPGHPLQGFLIDSYMSPDKPFVNNVWKDSNESLKLIPGPDGKFIMPKYPVAWSEVQSYVYGAWQAAGELYAKEAEQPGVTPEQKNQYQSIAAIYQQKAADLKKRFNERFWMPDKQFMAIALDNNGNQVQAVSSNGLHSMATGIVDQDKADRMIRRLFQNGQNDLLTGWGIRTLSAQEPAYDPESYHNGSIWAHDNWFIVKGLKRYGYTNAAREVGDRILNAAATFPDNRLPELYGGFPSVPGQQRIIPYPDASKPQAWACSTPIGIMTELLGLERQPGSTSYILNNPVLPMGASALDIENLSLPGRPNPVRLQIEQPPGRPQAQVMLKAPLSPNNNVSLDYQNGKYRVLDASRNPFAVGGKGRTF